MSNLKFEITNPEAIAIINKIKSGEYWNLVKEKLNKYRLVLAIVGVLILIITGLAIGKSLSSKTSTPIYTPTKLEPPTPTITPTPTSTYDSLKKSIKDFNTSLPDPALPVVENQIDLEPALK